MTKESEITVNLCDLPTGIRGLTLSDAENDARHLEALINTAIDKIVPLSVVAPEARADLHSATALLWVARDLAEALEGKIERIERHLEGGEG